MGDFKREGVYISADEKEKLTELFQRSREPVFGMTTTQTFRQAERVDKARAGFYELVDKVAVDHGLPTPEKDKDGDVIHYGLDFSNGELLTMEV